MGDMTDDSTLGHPSRTRDLGLHAATAGPCSLKRGHHVAVSLVYLVRLDKRVRFRVDRNDSLGQGVQDNLGNLETVACLVRTSDPWTNASRLARASLSNRTLWLFLE